RGENAVAVTGQPLRGGGDLGRQLREAETVRHEDRRRRVLRVDAARDVEPGVDDRGVLAVRSIVHGDERVLGAVRRRRGRAGNGGQPTADDGSGKRGNNGQAKATAGSGHLLFVRRRSPTSCDAKRRLSETKSVILRRFSPDFV